MVYFFKHNGRTRKVNADVQSLGDLHVIAREKFDLEGEPRYNIKDKQFGEFFELDDVEDLYDGAMLEIISSKPEEPQEAPEPQVAPEPMQAEPTHAQEDLQHQLSVMKRKIESLEDEKVREESSEAPKRQRVDARSDFGEEKLDNVEGWVSLIRGLSYHNDEDDVRKFFDGMEIELGGIFIIRNPKGQALGEGYVVFSNEEDREKSLKKHKQSIEKRYIEVYPRTIQDMARALEKAKSAFGLRNLPVRPGSQLIRMRGMPFNTTKEDIEKFFESVDKPPFAYHMMHDHLGRRNGDSFVEFESPKDATAGMKLNRRYIGNRYVEMYRSSPDELRSALAAGRVNNDSESTCVKLLGLPYNCTEDDITNFFQEVGVTPLRIHRKADGGEAYVEFRSLAETERGMSRHKSYIGSRYIDVYRVEYPDMARIVGLPSQQNNLQSLTPAVLQTPMFQSQMVSPVVPQIFASPPLGTSGFPMTSHPMSMTSPAMLSATSVQNGSSLSTDPTMYSTDPSMFSGARSNLDLRRTRTDRERPYELYQSKAVAGTPTKVRLSGLPFKAAIGDIQHFLRGFPIIDGTIEFVRDGEGRSTGDGYVTFPSSAEADRAVSQLNRKYIGDRYVILSIVKD